MTSEEQLALWVAGDSRHGEECCPDFSCCQSELGADAATRERFVVACRDQDENTKMAMLGMFLGAAFALAGKTIHVAGQDTGSS